MTNPPPTLIFMEKKIKEIPINSGRGQHCQVFPFFFHIELEALPTATRLRKLKGHKKEK